MFFFFTCGTHTFTSKLSGAEHITVQCQNCGNFSGRVMKRWEWFTFCFIPVIPFSIKPYKEVGCHICNFWQDIKYRPDVMAQIGQGGGGGGAVMMAGGGTGGGGGGRRRRAWWRWRWRLWTAAAGSAAV
ncbi:rhodopsin family [Pyrenophora seminiperda CCB06]|uniref:Rhodopsin family n=1 Tax=Pyrenophora seminiperda CCB06 TaxID=1302712 RepID=A0A3M7LZ97_9PLEO|nr:rhodopsin family [Pyrenophora seminiperda CCB06]